MRYINISNLDSHWVISRLEEVLYHNGFVYQVGSEVANINIRTYEGNSGCVQLVDAGVGKIVNNFQAKQYDITINFFGTNLYMETLYQITFDYINEKKAQIR